MMLEPGTGAPIGCEHCKGLESLKAWFDFTSRRRIWVHLDPTSFSSCTTVLLTMAANAGACASPTCVHNCRFQFCCFSQSTPCDVRLFPPPLTKWPTAATGTQSPGHCKVFEHRRRKLTSPCKVDCRHCTDDNPPCCRFRARWQGADLVECGEPSIAPFSDITTVIVTHRAAGAFEHDGAQGAGHRRRQQDALRRARRLDHHIELLHEQSRNKLPDVQHFREAISCATSPTPRPPCPTSARAEFPE